MDIHLQPLPAHSPDFMPVEHLWQWLREDITYHVCYDQEQELISAVADFQHLINTTADWFGGATPLGKPQHDKGLARMYAHQNGFKLHLVVNEVGQLLKRLMTN